jgi:hypothetical protein
MSDVTVKVRCYNCSWEQEIEFDTIPEWHNKPCPKCGKSEIVSDDELHIFTLLKGFRDKGLIDIEERGASKATHESDTSDKEELIKPTDTTTHGSIEDMFSHGVLTGREDVFEGVTDSESILCRFDREDMAAVSAALLIVLEAMLKEYASAVSNGDSGEAGRIVANMTQLDDILRATGLRKPYVSKSLTMEADTNE